MMRLAPAETFCNSRPDAPLFERRRPPLTSRRQPPGVIPTPTLPLFLRYSWFSPVAVARTRSWYVPLLRLYDKMRLRLELTLPSSSPVPPFAERRKPLLLVALRSRLHDDGVMPIPATHPAGSVVFAGSPVSQLHWACNDAGPTRINVMSAMAANRTVFILKPLVCCRHSGQCGPIPLFHRIFGRSGNGPLSAFEWEDEGNGRDITAAPFSGRQ